MGSEMCIRDRPGRWRRCASRYRSSRHGHGRETMRQLKSAARDAQKICGHRNRGVRCHAHTACCPQLPANPVDNAGDNGGISTCSGPARDRHQADDIRGHRSSHDMAAGISTPLRQMNLASNRPPQPGIHRPGSVTHHNGGRHIELLSGLVGIVRPDHEGSVSYTHLTLPTILLV